MRDIKFSDLKIGEEFEVYGDIHLDYNFPKICKCIKINDTTGQEIDGIYFAMLDNEVVSRIGDNQ